ncbi:adenine phosphoribosyltransferase [Saccharopolyspora lacisalsi]|uniref:Adenine phosphoribosyltransferase n=1 Tax=Halosaccharopolyspora lacisalsi TaxID=1000566 RepID=A0A839DPR8_9PSEU|nr:adenine phosphoribosyltransferase [Halosaccharopolyspora lacisalsi]MBA8823494.1 adenine phosphoribosyltransferase [Halosaccharopolyspora lacisalsi]
MDASVSVTEGGPALKRAAGLVREVPDFPEPGVLFRDIGPVLADPDAFGAVVHALGRRGDFDVVVGVEARGFLLGAAVAHACGTGVVGLRKPGKLPAVADRVDYDLEYGTATLELPADALESGQRVLVVDDVLATGGTLGAARQLADKAGCEAVGAAVVLELTALEGRAAVPDWDVQALFTV